jgi:hypothetical protein
MKAQWVRLVDVFAVGPLMLIAARETRTPWIRAGLVVFGVATVVYNAYNYLALRRP